MTAREWRERLDQKALRRWRRENAAAIAAGKVRQMERLEGYDRIIDGLRAALRREGR